MTDPDGAKSVLQASLEAEVSDGNFWRASSTAAQLVYNCIASGQLHEGLDAADLAIEYVQRAGLGPWTQLLAQIQRLQVLNAMGNHVHVSAEVQRLRERMETLSPTVADDDPAPAWDVREKLLDTGRSAARLLETGKTR